MAIGGFGFQSLGAYGAGAVNGGAGAYGVTDATGGATAAEAALASAQDKTFADVLQKAYDEGDKEKLKEVCTQFESIMLSMMYKGMKATVPESSLVEESRAQEIFDDMLDEELMNRAGSRGVGLADMLYKELSRQMDRTYLVPGAAGSVTGVGTGGADMGAGVAEPDVTEAGAAAVEPDPAASTEARGANASGERE